MRRAKSRNVLPPRRRFSTRLSLEQLEPRNLLSATPQMIDLYLGGASAPGQFVEVGNVAYFAANDAAHGRELWKTDGTAEGTVLVTDIAAGAASSSPANLTEVNGTLYFTATTVDATGTTGGTELWKIDASGNAVRVKDIYTGTYVDEEDQHTYPNSSSPGSLTDVNLTGVGHRLFFTATTAAGLELWMSDGTEAGTVMVKDIVAGSGSSTPGELVDVGGTLFFSAVDSTGDRELWKSDGTSAGTVRVADINDGESSNPVYLTAVGDTLFFAADDGTRGIELWKSDGTETGTTLVMNIRPGGDAIPLPSDPSGIGAFLAIGDKLFFTADDGTAGQELWVSDGTELGTSMVLDINFGSGSGLSVDFPGFTEFDGKLVFQADDGAHGTELWISDGTAGGTKMVTDLKTGTHVDEDDNTVPNGSSPYYMTVVDGTLYFTADGDGVGYELWQTDGSDTSLVYDLVEGSLGFYPTGLTAYDDILLFTGFDSSPELWTLDPNGPTKDYARLTIFANGQEIVVPATIGTTTDDVYTTDDNGQLIITPGAGATLGDVFDAWRDDDSEAVLSSTTLFDNVADATHSVQMFVNGYVVTDYENYVLQDRDEIVLVYTDNPVVSLVTNFGAIVIELFEGETPITVDNFLKYVNGTTANDGDYFHSFFHRSAENFVIQGGGFSTTSTTYGGSSQLAKIPTDPTIQNEYGISNTRGTVAMAKLGGDANSATSQFFFNLSDNSGNLNNQNGGFTVFGQVLGMTTVDALANIPIGNVNMPSGGTSPAPVTSLSKQLVVVTSVQGMGTLSGTKYYDANLNNVFDAGDELLAGVRVYADVNKNDAWDAGEPSDLTDADGKYTIHIAAGAYTVRAEASEAGRATSVPDAGYYAAVVEIGRETGSLNFGETTLTAPTGIDLLAAFDTGDADDDDMTRLNNADAGSMLSFLVSGVQSGATVHIYSGDMLIGTATAAGDSVIVPTDGETVLDDGDHDITAVQVVGAVTSDASEVLVVGIDTVAPAEISNAVDAIARYDEPFSFDVASDDEGEDGLSYSLVGAPTGMTIDPATGVIAWTPTLAQQGPQAAFQVVLSDNVGNSVSQTVEMTVLGVIEAYPDAVYTVDEDGTLVVTVENGVLVNDDPNEEFGDLTAIVVAEPLRGTLTLEPDGSFNYEPDANYFGEDSFTYKATAGEDESNVATVTITIANVADAPLATADEYTLDEGDVLSVNAANGVLKNDSDPDLGSLHATLVIQAAHGVVQLNDDGSFTYTPEQYYNSDMDGDDTFTYNVTNDSGETTGPITVTLTINAILQPPTVENDAYDAVEDQTLLIGVGDGVLLNDSHDPDSEPIELSVVTQPQHGQVVLNDNGSFTYTPAANYYGTDSFTYIASDGTNESQAATVTITIAAQPDAPTAVDDTVTAPNDGTATVLDVLANDTSEPDGEQELEITAVTQGAHGTVTITDGGDTVTYTAVAGYVGTDTFTYTITDPDGLTDTATVVVTVSDNSDNTLSGFVYIDADNDGVFDEGEIGLPGVLVTLTGTSTSGDAVSRTAITLNDGSYTFTQVPSGTYTLTEQQPTAVKDGKDTTAISGATTANDQFSDIVLSGGETLEDNNFGEGFLLAKYVSIRMFLASTPPMYDCLRDIFAMAEDGAGNSELADAIREGKTTLDGATNHAPVAVVDEYTLDAGVQQLEKDAAGGVLANDVDSEGDALTASLVAGPAHGDLTLNDNGSFTYTPDSGFSGEDSFTYKTSDGALTSNTTTVTITVDAGDEANQAPVAANDAYSVYEGHTLDEPAASGVLDNDSDDDDDSLTAVLVAGPAHGDVTLDADGSFTYTPDDGYSGLDTFTYKANDGSLESNTATVTITVNDAGAAPVAILDSYSMNEDEELEVSASEGVLKNDSDEDEEDTLVAIWVSGPAHGTLDLHEDGSFVYTPDADFFNVDSFTYQASDGINTSNTVIVNILVSPINDAPVAVDDSYTTKPGQELTVHTGGVLTNDTDAEHQLLSVTDHTDPAHGQLSIESTGGFTYTPEAGFTGEDTFTYVVSDGNGGTAVGTVTIAVNNPPEAVDDEWSVDANGALTVPAAQGVLSNDSDPNDHSLTATLVTGPSHGTLTLNADGSFEYNPEIEPIFVGTDSFVYEAVDELGGATRATVTITVVSLMQVRTAVTDASGTVLTSVTVGESFVLNVYVKDTSLDPQGVKAAYVDVHYGEALVSVDGEIEYSPSFSANHSGDTATAGLINEAGARADDGVTHSAGDEVRLFRIPFVANADGTVDFTIDWADDSPLHDMYLYGTAIPLNPAMITFLNDTSLEIRAVDEALAAE